MRRSLKGNVLKRIAANRLRVEQERERDQKEREVIRVLVQQVEPAKDDVVGQYAAGVIRVKRIG